jgi:hypothetical protein
LFNDAVSNRSYVVSSDWIERKNDLETMKKEPFWGLNAGNTVFGIFLEELRKTTKKTSVN